MSAVAEVTASGVDTVSYAFRPPGAEFFGLVDGFQARPHRYGAAGSLVADERGPGGDRLLCFPRSGMVAVESRLAALLEGDERAHDLTPARLLAAGSRVARVLLAEHCAVDPGAVSEVRRFDLAAELRFAAPSDGLAFLRTVAGMIPARCRGTHEVDVAGSMMTAYARTARRGIVHSRIYDKGRESGSDPPGVRVRIEDQTRPPKAKRYSPEVLAEMDLTATFGRTMNPYLKSQDVTVAGPDGAVADLAARAIRGELTHARAERLIGSVALLKHGGRAVYDRPDSNAVRNNERSSRRLKALRDAGVVLSDELPAESLVPVSELLRQAVERFSA